MNKEELLDSIGQVKEEFIEEAAPKGVLENKKQEEKSQKPKVMIKNITPYLKWGALAACLCILVGLSMKMNLFSASKEDAALEMKDTVKNQTEESESIMDSGNSKADTSWDNYSVDADFNTSISTEDANRNLPEEPMQEADKGFPDWGLTLSVKNVTLTGLTLVVKQEGGNPTGNIMTGEAYYLITLTDETWEMVEELPLPEGVDGRGFNSLAYWIEKGETKEFAIDWEWIFGELPGGTYRIVKEFMDFRETGDYDTFDYWVEFEIK